jgi:hypothetical protein
MFNVRYIYLFKQKENREIALSVDDAITQHFSTLLNFFAQTLYRNSPVRRISLESNMQVFFDQVYSNTLSSELLILSNF